MYKYNDITYSIKNYRDIENIKGYVYISNDAFKIIENGYSFLIYSYLCSKFNKDKDYTSVSFKTIAKDLNVSLSTVKRCIKDLEGLNLIKKMQVTRKDGGKGTNIYYIYYPTITNNKEMI